MTSHNLQLAATIMAAPKRKKRGGPYHWDEVNSRPFNIHQDVLFGYSFTSFRALL